MVGQNGHERLQVLSPSDPQKTDLMKHWKALAEDAWHMPGHVGWSMVTEPLVRASRAGQGGECGVQCLAAYVCVCK